MRSLLSSEQLEEMDGRLAVVDVSPSTGARFVKFWVDEIPLQDENVGEGRRETDPSFAQHAGSRTPSPMERERLETPARRPTGTGCSRESPDFGRGVDYHNHDESRRERLPDFSREPPPRTKQNCSPPEDSERKGMLFAFYGTATRLVL